MNNNNLIIDHIVEQLREVHHGKLWMGDTFAKKLGSITAEEAFIRPGNALHSVAELIAHLTAWRKDAILKIKTGKGQLTDDSEENWPNVESLKKIGWEQLLHSHQESLDELIALLQTKDDTFLQTPYQDQDFNGQFDYSFVINGMLHHDLYHLGQMGIVIKMIFSREPG
uniref:DinB family protein n=1 Tax=Roseihalotalea indica TaxID=2867963 RepID=A0AA49GL09_9BACT|nr:DinB family protein [Tunicatimonas sp. TK19036]